jgi:hypothetical protein
MDIIRRLARKIFCAFGNHYYKPLLSKFTFIEDEGDSWCFEIEDHCIYCGRPYRSLVNIPKPKIQAPESSEAGNLIQHVGYDEAQCGREK